MKTIIRTILCAAAVVLATVSCQKSIEPANLAEESKGTIDICVNGLMGEYTQQDGVKSSLVNTVRVAWAAGDVVYVFDGTKYLGRLTASLDKKADGETDEDRYAKLSGTISAPATTPCTLTLVHSSLMTEPAAGAAVSELSIDMSAQSTATVPFVAYATMDYTGESISDAVVPFQFATSVIKVNCTGLKAKTAITSATLSNVNTACKLTLSSNAAPIVSGDANGTITRTGDSYFTAEKVNSEGVAVFQIAAPKLETASEARVLTVAQVSNEFEYKKFSTKSLSAATSVNTVCQLVKKTNLPAGALPGVFSVSETKKVYFSQGNLWYDGSKFNFETNQYDFQISWSTSHVSHFYWSEFANFATAEEYDSYYDNLDKFFTNETETTAKAGFTVNVGGTGQTGWRTLSIKEWDYLLNTSGRMVNDKPCYSNAMSGVDIESVTYKGVFVYPDNYNGDIVSSSMTWNDINAAGIVFLPATGYRMSDFIYGSGYGFYWSSSLGEWASMVFDLCFDVGSVGTTHESGRAHGDSMRLVTDVE